MLSHELEFTLNQAFRQAREKRHEFMTVEHLLQMLLDSPSAASVLRACGADIDRLRRELGAFIDKNTPLLPEGDERDVQPTIGFSACATLDVPRAAPASARSPAPTCW